MRERRRFPRAKVFKGAKVVCRGQMRANCVIRNLSAEGAGLQLASTADLPAVFDLCLDTGHRLRECRVVWRSASDAGVAFAPHLSS
jgi:PilZ domain